MSKIIPMTVNIEAAREDRKEHYKIVLGREITWKQDDPVVCTLVERVVTLFHKTPDKIIFRSDDGEMLLSVTLADIEGEEVADDTAALPALPGE